MAVSLAEAQRAVTSALNAGTASVWGTTLADQRRSAGEIQHAIVSADADIVRARLETAGDPFRSGFMAASADLTYASDGTAPEIPDAIGEYGPVEIKIASGDSTYVTGTPTNLDDIELIRRNPNSMFGSAHTTAGSPLGGYYHILRPKLHFTGYAARVWVASFTPNFSSPACQAPDVDMPAVVAGAIARLHKEGDTNPEMFISAQRRFEAHLAGIRGKPELVPMIEMTQKAVG